MESNLQTGAVLFVSKIQQVADFYEQVAGLVILAQESDHIILERGSYQLVVHKIPEHYKSNSDGNSARQHNTLKPVYFIADISAARDAAARLGGKISAKEKEWDFQGTLVCDGVDPEGNIFQLRQSVS